MFYPNPITYQNYPIISQNYPISSQNYPIMIYNPTKPDLILLTSIILETCSTIMIKKTLNNKLWFIPVYVGYGLSFYMFPKSLSKFSLSSAYNIWCGVGILLTLIFDNIIYKEFISIKKLVGSLIIIYGIKLSH